MAAKIGDVTNAQSIKKLTIIFIVSAGLKIILCEKFNSERLQKWLVYTDSC